MNAATLIREAPRRAWTQRHLLGLEELRRDEIELILDGAEEILAAGHHRRKKRDDLAGKVIVNLFFEPSTRTRTSFSLAARRLSADTLDFTPSSSSLSKGETFIDTAKNIEAMGVDVMVVRHTTPGALICCRKTSTAASSTPATALMNTRRRVSSTSSPSAATKNTSRG